MLRAALGSRSVNRTDCPVIVDKKGKANAPVRRDDCDNHAARCAGALVVAYVEKSGLVDE